MLLPAAGSPLVTLTFVVPLFVVILKVFTTVFVEVFRIRAATVFVPDQLETTAAVNEVAEAPILTFDTLVPCSSSYSVKVLESRVVPAENASEVLVPVFNTQVKLSP